jgi:hypothetical protein
MASDDTDDWQASEKKSYGRGQRDAEDGHYGGYGLSGRDRDAYDRGYEDEKDFKERLKWERDLGKPNSDVGDVSSGGFSQRAAPSRLTPLQTILYAFLILVFSVAAVIAVINSIGLLGVIAAPLVFGFTLYIGYIVIKELRR